MRDSLYMHAAAAVLGMLASQHVLWGVGIPYSHHADTRRRSYLRSSYACGSAKSEISLVKKFPNHCTTDGLNVAAKLTAVGGLRQVR